MLSRAGLYLRTLRYLKPVQVVSRFKILLPVWNRPAPVRPRLRTGAWAPPIPRAAAQTGRRRFRFLNQEREIETWNDSGVPRLWLYNLHYFEHPTGELIRSWIAENPPAKGTGWEPYPLSLRIPNWIKFALNGNDLDTASQESLAGQLRFLARRMEYHLLANHLLANAKALVFGGCFFAGPEADGWLRRGIRILQDQLPEQILADGGHYERSPMYHSLVLEDLLDLANLRGAYPCLLPDWSATASRMLGWLANMTHPDGRIALLNDAAFDVAPEPAAIHAYGSRLHIPARCLLLDDSGYTRLEAGHAVAIFDAGPLGPDYQPGHGHADALSFELSWAGRRLIVDSGTSTYYPLSSARLHQRGTIAHNTLLVDGRDQSEVWDCFRVGSRSRILERRTDNRTWAEAAHDGYTRLRSGVIHYRRLELAEQSLQITDSLRGTGEHAVESRFHLHPESAVEISLDPALAGRWEASTYHPGFNISVPNTVLVARWAGQCPVTFHTRIVPATAKSATPAGGGQLRTAYGAGVAR